MAADSRAPRAGAEVDRVPAPFGSRQAELDLLKAAGIVAVVLIHAMRGPFEPGATRLELLLGEATRFAVPAFLFASGALAARPRQAGAARVAATARVARLLLPYLVASIAAELYRAGRDLGPGTGSVALDLLLGAAFGPYYYVFVALPLVLLEPLARRLDTRVLAVFTAALLVAQAASEALLVPLPMFWHLRSPLLWWGYWFLGALYGRYRATLGGRLAGGPATRTAAPESTTAAGMRTLPSRAAAVAAAAGLAYVAAVAAGYAAPDVSAADRLSQWLAIHCALAALLALGHAARRLASAKAIVLLSIASYTIYLWHLFAVEPLRELVAPPPGVLEPLAIVVPWAGGLLLPLLLLVAGRRVLGLDAARRWLGG